MELTSLLKFVATTLNWCLVFGDGKVPLYFSYITSLTPESGFSAAGGIPTAIMALDIINNQSDILANYSLQFTEILDSKCNRTAALDAFFKHITDENVTYIATTCCGCSTATIPVAEISHYWNIPQISHSAALELNDRSRFRNFFRMLPTNQNLGPGIVRVAEFFKWKKMMIITQNEDFFHGLTRMLQSIVKQKEWIIDTSIELNSDIDNGFPNEAIFNKIEREHFRIILINTYSKFAHHLFCEAFKRKLLAPKYVWITHPWYNKEWWTQTEANVSCTANEMRQAVNNSIGVIPDGFLITNFTKSTSSGLTPAEFLARYIAAIHNFTFNNIKIMPASVPNIGFDLVWAMALGLNKTAERVAQLDDSGCEDLSGDIVPLEDFDYSNEKMGCILRQSIGSITFDGLSGRQPVQFNHNGSRLDDLLLVQQYLDLDNDTVERITVATVDIRDSDVSSSIEFLITNESTFWKGLDKPPYDGYPESSNDGYNIILFSFCNLLVAIGFIFSIVCIIFNFAYRNKKVLKLSSYNLNYLILFGSIVLYSCILLYVYMPSKVDLISEATAVCNLRVWLFSLGYSVCFAVTLSKTWRVYYIFNDPSVRKKVIKDWMLLIIIVMVVFGDLLILLIGTIIPSSRLKASEIRSKENPTTVESDSVEKNYIYICLELSNDSQIIWLSISFAYKGFLQLIAIFMAFHIRKVKIKALNDSKETAAIIYINTIILIILCASVFFLEEYHNAHGAVFGLALFVQASLFLGLLFVPKMIAIYRDPDEQKFIEEQIAGGSTKNKLSFPSITESSSSKDKSEILALQAKVKELEDTVTALKTRNKGAEQN